MKFKEYLIEAIKFDKNKMKKFVNDDPFFKFQFSNLKHQYKKEEDLLLILFNTYVKDNSNVERLYDKTK
jgi:phosphoenolpyruvate carboxylase